MEQAYLSKMKAMKAPELAYRDSGSEIRSESNLSVKNFDYPRLERMYSTSKALQGPTSHRPIRLSKAHLELLRTQLQCATRTSTNKSSATILCLVLNVYTGWWLTYPSEEYESQLGSLFPIYRGKKCSKPPTSISRIC